MVDSLQPAVRVALVYIVVKLSEIAGLWGMVVGAPLIAAVRDMFL